MKQKYADQQVAVEQKKEMRPARKLRKQNTFDDHMKPEATKQKASVKLEDFDILKVIDKGSFGKVFLVELRDTGKLYAMKRIRKDILIEKGQIQNTYNERDILLKTSHPFLLGMDYVF